MNSQEFDEALQKLDLCESILREYTGDNTLDYGICRVLRGRIHISLGDTLSATKFLKQAEKIIEKAVGSSNSYMKGVYYCLFTAYTLSQDHTHALEYQKKYKDLNQTLRLSNHKMNR